MSGYQPRPEPVPANVTAAIRGATPVVRLPHPTPRSLDSWEGHPRLVQGLVWAALGGSAVAGGAVGAALVIVLVRGVEAWDKGRNLRRAAA